MSGERNDRLLTFYGGVMRAGWLSRIAKCRQFKVWQVSDPARGPLLRIGAKILKTRGTHLTVYDFWAAS